VIKVSKNLKTDIPQRQISRVPEYYTWKKERYIYDSKSHSRPKALVNYEKLLKYGYKVIIVKTYVNQTTFWWAVYKKIIPEYRTKNDKRMEVCKIPSKMSKEQLIRVIERIIMMSGGRLKRYNINTYKGMESYPGFKISDSMYVYMDSNDGRFKDDSSTRKGKLLSSYSKSDLIWMLKKAPRWQDFCY